VRIWIVDAFTDRPFSGNPAAVCLLDGHDWPADEWMRQTAIEMNLPMTAFIHRTAEDADADWALRWLNPVIEEKLCGHATLATVHVLRSAGEIVDLVRFSTASGVLAARAEHDGLVTLDFPAAAPSEIPVASGLAKALGASPAATYATGGLGDVVAVLSDEAAVRALRPDMRGVEEFTTTRGLRAITVTAQADDSAEGYDFVSRFFSPASGLPEDPVTGSAHTALAPYWSERLGRNQLTGLQASARTGLVHTEVRGDRVLLSGRCATVLEGSLLATPDLTAALPAVAR
jgi:PhzF family phenazine biosynthesis protein